MMVALVLVSRVLGVLRDVLLGHFYGQNEVSDVFRAAFAVPDLLYLVVAGGALSSVFVPVFAEYWNTGKEEEAWTTFGATMSIVGIATALAIVVLEAFAPAFVRVTNPAFSAKACAAVVPLTRILLPAQWFFFVGGLMMGALYARQRFWVPALGSVIYNAGLVGGCLAGGLLFPHQRYPEAMAWGAAAGAGVGTFVLPLLALARLGARWDLRPRLRHPGVRKVGRLMVPVLLGLSLSQLNMWLTRLFLPEGGWLSALSNAYVLTQAPIGIFAQTIGIVFFPGMSALAATGNWRGLQLRVEQALRYVSFLTLPASALLVALADPLVRLFFKGGKFRSEDVPIAASALMLYALGTCAWSAMTILARAFYAQQDTRTPIYVTTPSVAAFLLLGWLLKSTALGYRGLALATSLVAFGSAIAMTALFARRSPHLSLRRIARGFAGCAVAALVSGAAAWFVAAGLRAVFPAGRIGAAVEVIGGGLAGSAAYLLAATLLRLQELALIRAIRQARGAG